MAADRAANEPLIGIIGGGIGGFALAVALQKKRIRSVVFEKDVSHDSRSQGYGLTLQQGGRALKSLGIIDSLRQVSTSSSSHFIFNHRGEVVIWWGAPASVQEKGAAAQQWSAQRNAHIPRQSLRRVLFEQLNPEFVTVHWSSPVTSIEEGLDSVHIVTPTASAQVHCVVGADGIFSKVRSFCNIPDDKLLYRGVFVMLGIFDHAPYQIFGERVVQMSDGGTRIFMMPFDGDRYMWQLSFAMPDLEQANALSKAGSGGLLREARARCADFHSPIPEFLGATSESLVTGYPVFDRDPLAQDFHPNQQSRVTLLGDAAHPMTPFKGQGANQALVDAVNLADLLAVTPISDYAMALRKFEAEMMNRSKSKVIGSREAVPILHSPEYLDSRCAIQRLGFMSPADAELLHRLALMSKHRVTIDDPIQLDRFSFADVCQLSDNAHDPQECKDDL